ncbi:MAG TPA: GlsB/YeaQ/YmgE family stress response membrane protein [Gemmatimonadales bacterium]|jgi:uncharacterized membrane protein YeaQ/YmgE (transglycosylase-associated protein family)
MIMMLIWFLLVGLVAGWLAGKIMKGSGYGVIGDIVLGVIGAVVGGFLFRLVGIAAYGTIGAIIVATIGAIVLVALARALKKA